MEALRVSDDDPNDLESSLAAPAVASSESSFSI